MIGGEQTNEWKNTRTDKYRQLQSTPLNTAKSIDDSFYESAIGGGQT